MIYFDHAASSPLSEKALEVYSSALKDGYANPSSQHAAGRKLSREIDRASEEILSLLGLGSAYRIVWTSSATEANNLALKGIARAYMNRGRKIVSSLGEHPSVIEPLRALEKEGYAVDYLPLTKEGAVDLEVLREALSKEVVLVSLIATNNETGSETDLAAVRGLLAPFPKALFHTDITQALGKSDLPYSSADLLSFSAHKFGGPKGVGGLLLKKTLSPCPLLDGGGQEGGLRSGTVNYPGIIASCYALKDAISSLKENRERVSSIWGFLYSELSKNPEISINSPSNCSPYILNFSLKHKKASVILEALSEEGIFVSSHSACSSKITGPSSPLLSMGKSPDEAENAIRLSFGPESTLEEAKGFLSAFNLILERIIDR